MSAHTTHATIVRTASPRPTGYLVHNATMVSASQVGSAIAGIPKEMASALHMKPVQALVWFSCWSCWTLASMQYYALPFTTTNLAKTLGVTAANIQEANTTSMLSRSIGAVIFGILSDQYGRKW